MIMYIFDINIYLGLAILIQSYRYSWPSFLEYIKSFFKKVERKANLNSSLLIRVNKFRSILIIKSFGDLKSVDNFNGELFPNEIFCLLGHNGINKKEIDELINQIELSPKKKRLYAKLYKEDKKESNVLIRINWRFPK